MADNSPRSVDEAAADSGNSMDAVIDVYKKDVDRILLIENLKLTVEERLLKADRMHRSVDAWRGTGTRRG